LSITLDNSANNLILSAFRKSKSTAFLRAPLRALEEASGCTLVSLKTVEEGFGRLLETPLR
jgi:hypothetical protein